ncbi:hypothetical protein PST407_04667 [Pseudomonas syringae pv. tomato]|nr:hypothetical protein PSTA9_05450 [Pseudomonas syringae pv. tomato]KUR43647.1 hypothetical protein PST407_04667 [Pseudomonas syringae pv. tomato]
MLDLVHHQLFNRAPRPVLGLPDDLPVGIGHFQWCADLVGVVVVNLVFGFAFFFVHTCERRIASGFVEVQAALAGALFAQHAQALPEEAFLVALAFDLGLFTYSSAQAVVLIAAGAFHLRIGHGLGFDQAVFAVVGEGLPAHDADGFFDQVAPGVVFVFVVAPLFEAVVFDVVEAAGVEVQPVGRCVVAELFAIDDQAVVARQQLAVGFVFVAGFAAQFVEGAAQFAGRVVFVTAVDGVVGVFDVAFGFYQRVLDLRQLFGRQSCGVLPGLAAHAVVAEATGEFALRAVDLAVQVVALHVADQLAIKIQLMQVAAAVIQVVQVLAGGKRQRGQVAQRIVVVGQRALWRGLFDESAQQVVGKFQFLGGDTEFSAGVGLLALNRQQPVAVVVGVVLARIVVEFGQQATNRVALKKGAAAWLFAFVAVADLLDLCQVPAEVVAETAGEVVDALFFDQAVGIVVGEVVGGVVFVGQGDEADGLVVLVGNGFALGVFTSGRQTTGVA